MSDGSSDRAEDDDWEEEAARRSPSGDAELILDIEGFEGPLDLLLTLARTQKVDLAKISILELVEQYLAFIGEARKLQLEVAADYLVMAAWLAFLKSRLLLPDAETESEETGEAMAARLQFQLMRLEAMREKAAQLMSRHRLGQDVFARGAPEGVRVMHRRRYELSYYELLRAYGIQQQRHRVTHLHMARPAVYAIEDILHRLEPVIGQTMDWTRLEAFLPPEAVDPVRRRSALASSLAATLEVARQGWVEVRQATTFGPIYVRRKPLAGDGEGP